jgi:hypothetical protein
VWGDAESAFSLGDVDAALFESLRDALVGGAVLVAEVDERVTGPRLSVHHD